MYTYSHYIFFIWSNSKLLCSGMQEYRNMYSIECQKLLNVCMCMCVFKFFFEITEPTEDKVHVGPPRDRGKIYSNDSGQLLCFIIILIAPGGGDY